MVTIIHCRCVTFCRYYKTPQDTNCQGSLNVHEYLVSDGTSNHPSNPNQVTVLNKGVSAGADWERKNPNKKEKHPLIIILEPHNQSVSVREYCPRTPVLLLILCVE